MQILTRKSNTKCIHVQADVILLYFPLQHLTDTAFLQIDLW